jgi:hypothetical protein
MIFDLFSKRQKDKERSGQTDIYQYDVAPKFLRVQIQQILVESIGPQYEIDPYDFNQLRHNPEAWNLIRKTLCRELGVHNLNDESLSCAQILQFVGTTDGNGFIDAIELCVRWIERIAKPMEKFQLRKLGIEIDPQEGIEEINYRFRQANLGYQFEDGEAFRVDSQFTHEEIVKPSLKILRGAGFEGPQAEFLEAHKKYRSGEHEQSVIEAGKAFESTLKVICDQNGWDYLTGARASDLLKVVRANGLWPNYLDGSFDQLVATLASGLPKIRNDTAAHGQGSKLRTTPAYVAHYALNLCAVKIVLLAQAHESRVS